MAIFKSGTALKSGASRYLYGINDDTITEANEAIRQLIETIRLVPFNGRLKIELFGELAALLNLGMAPKNEHPLDNSKGVQVTVVAGAGFVQDPTIKIFT